MTPLPEPPPGWPGAQPYAMPCATTSQAGAVELSTERPAVVYVPAPGGQMVPVLREYLPSQPLPYQPRDLTPQPAIDPVAQRLVAVGALSAGAGWGAAQVVTAVAGAGTGLLVLALLLLAARMRSGGQITNITYKTVHATTSWFGRSDISQ